MDLRRLKAAAGPSFEVLAGLPLVAGLAYLHLAGELPVAVPMALIVLTGLVQLSISRADSSGRFHWRVGLHMAASTAAFYSLGWGAVLSGALVINLAHQLRWFGTTVWRPAAVYIGLCILAGQLAITAGLPSNVRSPDVHGLAVLGGVIVLMIVRLLGTAAEERDLAELAVRQSEERFRTLVQQSSDLITVVDAAGHITFASSSSAHLLGYDPERLVGSNAVDLLRPEQVEELTCELHALMDEPGAMVRREQELRIEDGTYRWFHATARNLLHDPAVAGIVINQRDVTDQRAWNELLAHQASHDVLTGLLNRASFLHRLDQALSRRRRQGGIVAVLFIDLDGFKTVNDSLGHQTGDIVLCQIAERLRSAVRPEDTVSRFAGDEFTVLLEDVGEKTVVAQLTARMHAIFAEPIHTLGREVTIGASVGVAFAGADDTADVMVHAADSAMYNVKHARSSRDAVIV